MMRILLLFIRLLSYTLLTVICWFICGFIGAKCVWGQVDMAMVIQHTQMLFTVPWAPYWKELTAGFTGFFILTWAVCRYWKVSMGLILSFFLFFVGKNIYSAYIGETAFYTKNYVIPDVSFTEKSKNIIVVSLESFDDMLTNPKIVGEENLIPFLTDLKSQGVVVDGYHGINSMGPTIPSFYAMNCGIPRGTSVWRTFETLFSKENFGTLPNAVCV